MYSIEALENGIEKIKKNILVLEDAIEKERSRIKEYYGMIDTIKRKERENALASQSIKITRDKSNDNTDGRNN
jgi:predicted  nucleic acid-binding Zn-ribbon protein